MMIISLKVSAETSFRAQIHNIDFSSQVNEDSLLFLSNGQVAKINNVHRNHIKTFEEGMRAQLWFDFTLDKNRYVEKFEISKEQNQKNIFNDGLFERAPAPFLPSVLDSLETAKKLHRESPYNPKESQCYNRAHVWSYEWRKKQNLYTSKAWLFFTRKYIRKYNFEWWFHVAPLVHVVEDGLVKEKIIDVKYAKIPLRLKQWSDIFLRNDAICPVVENYSEQANYPESSYCFVMKSSMYFYQPIDLENFEKFGIEKFTWNEFEIKQAYLEAFDISL